MNKLTFNFNEYIFTVVEKENFDDSNVLGTANGTHIDNIGIQININDNGEDAFRINYNELSDLSPYTITINDETDKLDEFIKLILTMPTIKVNGYSENVNVYMVTPYCCLLKHKNKILSTINYKNSMSFILLGKDYTWESIGKSLGVGTVFCNY